MKFKPDLQIIKGLLFTYCIENSRDSKREELICSKNVNNEQELISLFETLTKPELMRYKPDERRWHIDTLQYFLEKGDGFESVFYLFDTYFEDEILNKRKFMLTLLNCLVTYDAEATATKTCSLNTE